MIMNNTENETQNKRYQDKYKFMKKRIKNIILENAALCDEVAKVQENIMIVKEERKFLLNKILEYENDPDTLQPYTKNESMNTTNGPKVKLKKRQSLEDTK